MEQSMKKIGMVSLGCPKNSVDTEFLLGDLVGQGYEFTTDQKKAEVLIVNTCGFIESAKRESVDAILEMARLKTDGNCERLIVTGCLAERYTKDLLEEIPEIDHMLGVNQYPLMKEILARAAPGSKRNYVNDPAQYFESYADRVLTTPFYSAYLKISEGCSNKCAFCIIPAMRGPIRSMPLPSLVKEAEGLAAKGVRELNLISQDTTMYGFDIRMKDGLIRLLKELIQVKGIEWLRLLYCYPTFITSELMDFIAAEEKVCSYVDVPLQHIHDAMLKGMKRQETESQVRRMIEQLRCKIPNVAIRTTFIVGFPGETDAYFQHLTDFVREIEFDHVGVFAYSDEEGTTAYNYTDKVPQAVGEERWDILMGILRDIHRKKNNARIGEIHPVLVEGLESEQSFLMTGRLETQAPEIDGQVIIEKSQVEPGEIVPMRITAVADYDLIATALDPVEAVES
jgi:ribosomal protein S12 methylthiotransferase